MKDLYTSAQSYLLEHNVLSLATCDNSIPWVAPVFYAVAAGKIIFLSAPHTRHCKNIAVNPMVAASVQEDYRDWEAIKGFQIQGEVHQLIDADVPHALSVYSDKFPVTGRHAPPEIANALDKISWFALSVTTIHFIDNSKGLGHRDKLDPARLLSI